MSDRLGFTQIKKKFAVGELKTLLNSFTPFNSNTSAPSKSPKAINFPDPPCILYSQKSGVSRMSEAKGISVIIPYPSGHSVLSKKRRQPHIQYSNQPAINSAAVTKAESEGGFPLNMVAIARTRSSCVSCLIREYDLFSSTFLYTK
jgi:hypothetical protein